MRRVVNKSRPYCTTRPIRRDRFGDRAHCATAARVRIVSHKRARYPQHPTRGAVDGHRERRRIGIARFVGGDGQGPEKRRHRVRLQHRHRRRIDRAGVLARGDARLHRRRQGRRRACPGGDARRVHPDAARRLGLQILQPRRPRRRHDVRVDDPRLRPDDRLAERLGDLPRRRDRDGLAGGHRRDLHVQAVRLHRTRRIESRDHHRRRPLDRDHDLDLLPRHRAVRAHPAGAAQRRGVHPRAVRRGRVRQGLRQPPAGGLDQGVRCRGSTRSR